MRRTFGPLSSLSRVRACALALMFAVAAGTLACGETFTSGRSDDQIRRDALAALEAANLAELTLEVKDGAVTLSGGVYRAADVERAESVVKGVEGVRSVDASMIAREMRTPRPGGGQP